MTFTSENLLRELAPQVLGAMVRRFRDFAAAEDAVQESLLAAAVQWPEQGVPENPRGWLIHVASRRMTDAIRADLARRRRETGVVAEAMEGEPAVPSPDSDGVEEHDDSLVAPVHVLSPVADPAVGDCADAAGGRRVDDGRDRPRVPGARGDDGAADQPGEETNQALGGRVPDADR